MPVSPASAAVRPRVSNREFGVSRLLEDVVAELIEDGLVEVIWIDGAAGGGKSTALAHLADCFAQDERLVFIDDPRPSQVDRFRVTHTVIAATESIPRGDDVVLRLEPWGFDELVEYVLAKDRTSCQAVIGRLGQAACKPWTPEVAQIVLQSFLSDESLTDPGKALVGEVHNFVSNPKQRDAVAEFCLAALIGGSERILEAAKQVGDVQCPEGIFKLLRHDEVQTQFVGDYFASLICSKSPVDQLGERLPLEIVEIIADRCRDNPSAHRRIHAWLESKQTEQIHPMVASILFRMDSKWCPAHFMAGRKLAGGYFCGAHWPLVNLASAKLWGGDYSAADLSRARLDHADAPGAKFDGAEMHGAHLNGMNAPSASFCGADLREATLASGKFHEALFVGANLTQARLTGADLIRADFTGAKLCHADFEGARLQHAILAEADLSNANFKNANLSGCDLRDARLLGACFDGAILVNVQMEDIESPEGQFTKAQLTSAHLTGSRMPRVKMQDANLVGTYLAEIDWAGADLRNADLRGAIFHMGSSRSGLVGSPIAREGSMTGFYTDEREEMYFKRPEEIRKANLRGADLWGAKIEGADFYLVDLRDARLDQTQWQYAKHCGAILS
jgi:uncharacterized protein YjbI with pentapeptide repeats